MGSLMRPPGGYSPNFMTVGMPPVPTTKPYPYPRYDQPGFLCVTNRHYSTRMKNTADAPQPPWPVFDVPNPDPDLSIDYENYPTLNKRVLEEEDPRPLGLGREEDLQPPAPLEDGVRSFRVSRHLCCYCSYSWALHQQRKKQ
ncbi:hypothetical protein NEUTE2DRAFT_153245 [Neurospora tetrasperma FGSC 2509]|nr:hypothetical protein NEUTE2DRAFT_153245 [Neurospora tetrasperma FGSC 2509]